MFKATLNVAQCLLFFNLNVHKSPIVQMCLLIQFTVNNCCFKLYIAGDLLFIVQVSLSVNI